MSPYSSVQVKHTLVTNRATIIAGCLLVAVVCGALVATGVVTPAMSAGPDHEEGQPTSVVYGASAEQDVSVTVTESTAAFTEGETLSGVTVYPLEQATDPTVTTHASGENAVITDIVIRVTYEAAPATDNTAVFYTEETTLASAQPGESQAELNTTVPIQEVLTQWTALQEEFGSGITVTTHITTEINYRSVTEAGENREGSLQTRSTLTRVGNMYSLPGDQTRTTETIQTGTTPAAAGSSFSLANLGILSIGFLALLGLVGSVVITRRVDRDALFEQVNRERFAQWVTEIESYTPQGEIHTVEVTSLNDLVDLAIDTQNRVLYNRQLNEYFVIEETTMFKYTPETSGELGNTEFFGFNPTELDSATIPTPPQQPGSPPAATTDGKNSKTDGEPE